MNDSLSSFIASVLWLGYIIGPFFGIYAAVVNGSFLNALLSLFVPFYGVIYFFLT